MGCIIVMMPKQEDAIRLKAIIRNSYINEDVVVSSRGSETLELVASRNVSVVICTKKARDMGYEELSSYLPAQVSILLLTKDPSLIPFSSNVMKLMVPFGVNDLINSLRILLPEAHAAPKKRKPPAGRSPTEQKIVDRAKAILMKVKHMTEPEAFRYIQKKSMDSKKGMLEIAQAIIATNGG